MPLIVLKMHRCWCTTALESFICSIRMRQIKERTGEYPLRRSLLQPFARVERGPNDLVCQGQPDRDALVGPRRCEFPTDLAQLAIAAANPRVLLLPQQRGLPLGEKRRALTQVEEAHDRTQTLCRQIRAADDENAFASSRASRGDY